MINIMPEITAMQTIAEAISSLSPAERRRVIAWVAAFADDASMPESTEPAASPEPELVVDPDPIAVEPAPEEVAPVEPETPEALFAAIAPKTGAQKAATAAYWLETREGKGSWKASEVNKLLKAVGAPVSSISIVLTNAVKAKTPLVAELERLGDSQRSRKTFCLSDAGRAFVEGRLQ